jgi:hypothetical protein
MVTAGQISHAMQGETEIAGALAWLEPLRFYPRWLVLSCVAIVAGGLLTLLAKPLKWGLYAGLALMLGVFMSGFAWWLEQ